MMTVANLGPPRLNALLTAFWLRCDRFVVPFAPMFLKPWFTRVCPVHFRGRLELFQKEETVVVGLNCGFDVAGYLMLNPPSGKLDPNAPTNQGGVKRTTLLWCFCFSSLLYRATHLLAAAGSLRQILVAKHSKT